MVSVASFRTSGANAIHRVTESGDAGPGVGSLGGKHFSRPATMLCRVKEAHTVKQISSAVRPISFPFPGLFDSRAPS